MSNSLWYDAAMREIVRIGATLPAAADWRERAAALRGKGKKVHLGTAHGQLMWRRAVHDYLDRYGRPGSALPKSPLERARERALELQRRADSL